METFLQVEGCEFLDLRDFLSLRQLSTHFRHSRHCARKICQNEVKINNQSEIDKLIDLCGTERLSSIILHQFSTPSWHPVFEHIRILKLHECYWFRPSFSWPRVHHIESHNSDLNVNSDEHFPSLISWEHSHGVFENYLDDDLSVESLTIDVRKCDYLLLFHLSPRPRLKLLTLIFEQSQLRKIMVALNALMNFPAVEIFKLQIEHCVAEDLNLLEVYAWSTKHKKFNVNPISTCVRNVATLTFMAPKIQNADCSSKSSYQS
jgi:hypothetical protein